MNGLKRILLFLLLVPAISYSQQDTVFLEKKADSVAFQYAETPGIKDSISNFFIETLSKSIPKILDYTHYSFSFVDNIFITNAGKQTKAGRNYLVSFSVLNGKCSGDVFYKGFRISDVLTPNFFNLSIDINNSFGKTLKTVDLIALKLHNGESGSQTFIFHDSLISDKYEVTFKNKLFYYNDSAYAAFKKKIELINSYYSSEFVIADALEKISKMNFDDVELVKIFEIDLKNVEKIVADLKEKDYATKLDLAAFDPIDFVSKFKNLVQQTEKQRFMINNLLSSIDRVYYNKGCDFLENNDMTEALKYFEKSIAANAFYSPSYYQMAGIYYSQDSIGKAIEKLTMLLAKLNPDQSTLKKALLLGNTVYTHCLTKGEEFEKAENYNDALLWLGKAKEFCTNAPLITCSEELQKSIAKGHFGIYNSYCIVSQMAINKEAYVVAEIYTLKAKAYQKEFSSDIIFATEADALLGQLVKGLITKGMRLNVEKRFDSALVVLEKASKLCADYSGIKCDDKLKPAINVARKGAYKIFIAKTARFIKLDELEKADSAIAYISSYQQLYSTDLPTAKATDSLMVLLEKKRYDKDIVDGINDLRNMDGEKALNNFELAKNLEKNYAFKKDSTLDSLIVASAEPYLLNYIETGCVKTWGNELDKARAIEDSAKKLQIKYALLTDSVIINALVDLKTKIFNRQCSNARDDFEEYYRDARRSVSQKNFAEADLYFAKCLKIASDNNNCSINDSVVVNDKAKYLSATTYQKMLRQTDSLEKLAKYRDAIDKYIKCSAYYSSHDIKAFGLVNVSLKDFLSAKANNDYLMESANYYFDQADYKNSVCFLEILRKNNYAPANTAAFQQKLATKLAIVDFAKDPKQKPTTLIKNYTIGNPWYVSFKKAYSGKWKELKKKQKSGGKESWFKHLLHNVTSKFGK